MSRPAAPTRVVPVLLLLLLLLAACSKSADPGAGAGATSKSDASTAPAASMAVTLAPVALRTLARGVVASGPVTAWEEMQLGVEVSGLRVTALHVDVGQRVARGQVLLELDHRTLDSDLRQADAAHAEAAAGVQLAATNLKRGDALVSSQLISASADDALRSALVQAQAREQTTRAQRDGVQLRRDFATLRAPDAGIISKRLVQPGQVVAGGSELLRLIRQGRLEWRPELAEADLARIAVGDAVQLHDSTGAEVTGRVRAVSPGVDTDKRTGTVYADLPDPAGLKVGAFVQGRIVTSASPGLVVPAAALLMRDGYAYVFTVDAASIAHRLRITLGERLGDWVEVREGLRASDRVVVTGAGFLGDGDHVRVVAGPTVGAASAATHRTADPIAAEAAPTAAPAP